MEARGVLGFGIVVVFALLACVALSFVSVTGSVPPPPPPPRPPSPAGPDAPVTFSGLILQPMSNNRRGTLEIRHRELRLRWGRQEILHRSRRVHVYCADAYSPLRFRDTGVLVQRGFDKEAVIVLLARERQAVLDALRAAGFDVTRHKSRHDVGLSFLLRPRAVV